MKGQRMFPKRNQNGGYTLVVRDHKYGHTKTATHLGNDELNALQVYEHTDAPLKSLWLEPRPGRPNRRLIMRSY